MKLGAAMVLSLLADQNLLVSTLSHGDIKIMNKTKFEEVYQNYKNDPFGTMKGLVQLSK
jgi:hypothetical protein